MTAAEVEAYPCGPAEDVRDLDYWDALRRGRLVVQRCNSCHTWLGGTRSICAECYTFDVSWQPVEAQGTVFTWCRTHYPYMSELADVTPYVSLVVELPGAGGVRVLGMLTTDSEPVRIGDQVIGSIEQPGTAAWALMRWRKVADSQGEPQR